MTAELNTSAHVFGQLMQNCDRQLLSTVQVMVADNDFKRMVVTDDTATVLSALKKSG